MKCPACKSGIMEEIVEGVLHCPDCNHLLKEKDIIDDGMKDLLETQGRAHLRPRRRVGNNWDEFQNKTSIYGEDTSNKNLIDSSPDQLNLNESSVTNFSDSNNIPQPGSTGLLNIEGESNQKEKNLSIGPHLNYLNQPFDSQEILTSDDINNDSDLSNEERERDLDELINVDTEFNLKKRQVFMVEVDNKIDVKSKIKWFEKKEQINGTIQYHISHFLKENFKKISNITFEMWVKYVNQKPSIKLDSQKLNTNTFEQYRKLWFLSEFKMTYREFYEISYKNYRYSDLQGKYFEDMESFIDIYLNILKLKNREEIKAGIINHYKNIIQDISYSDLPKRSRNPKYFASAMLFYFMNISQTDLTTKLNSGKNVKINLSNLSILIKFLYKIYFNNINISDYEPTVPDGIIDNNFYYDQLIEYLDEGIEILELPFESIKEKCINLYNQAGKNGFNIETFQIKHPKYLVATLIFLSSIINENIKNLTQSKIQEELIDFNLNPTYFSNTIRYFQKFLNELIIFPFQHSYNREIFEKQLRDIIKENPSYLEGKLILSMFELSNLDPMSFVKNLKIYELSKENLKPSVILDLLKRNTKFVQRKKFNEIISRFNDFIDKCIPNNSRQEAKKNLDKYIQERLLVKFDSLRRAKQKKRLTESLYGENFRSIEARFNNFCEMRGFSPFDGTDLIELLKKGETLGYHHMDYNPENDDSKNHTFVPKRVFENRGYISHNMISGLQASLERWKDRPDTVKKLKKKLEELYRLGLKNAEIIRVAVRIKKNNKLDELENWSKKSINMLRIRVLDEDFRSAIWKYKTKLSMWEHQYKDYENFY